MDCCLRGHLTSPHLYLSLHLKCTRYFHACLTALLLTQNLLSCPRLLYTGTARRSARRSSCWLHPCHHHSALVQTANAVQLLFYRYRQKKRKEEQRRAKEAAEAAAREAAAEAAAAKEKKAAAGEERRKK